MTIEVKIGDRFGRLVVQTLTTTQRKGQGRIKNVAACECLCDCGKTKLVRLDSLMSNHTKSCGCFGGNRTHGYSRVNQGKGTLTYERWSGMKKRCAATSKDADNYFNRGVFIAPEWLNFEVFFKDMGECPKGMTLERIDNNRGYEPGNCQWATAKEQARNRRGNRYVTMPDGRQITIAQAAEEHNIDQDVVYARLDLGWDLIKALTTPVRKRKK